MCNSELVTVKFIFLFFFNFDLSSASQSASSSLTIEGDVGKYYQALLELPNLEITDQRTHRNVPYQKIVPYYDPKNNSRDSPDGKMRRKGWY